MPTAIKRRTLPSRAGKTMPSLLAFLGFPKADVYADHARVVPYRVFERKKGHGFWVRNEERLYEMLAEARQRYRQRIQEAHPDHGGTTAEAQAINDAWDRVEKAFAYRGIKL